MSQHRIVVHHDKNDDYPRESIECDWGNDPDRPCRSISCEQCLEYSNVGCLTEHGAVVVDGCGLQEWLTACGMDGVAVRGLLVKVPVEIKWDGDGWMLQVSPSDSEAAVVVPDADG